MGKQFSAIIYAADSLLHRGSIVSDDVNEFLQACSLASEGGLYKVLNATDLEINFPPPWDVETMNAAIAAHEGVRVKDLPTGRCAAVHPETREIIEFLIADPAIDAITEDHHIGGDKACELHAIDDGKLGDKITEAGDLLARVVTGDRKGKVDMVDWFKPDAIPEGAVEDSTAKPGDTVEGLILTDVPSEGTVKL
jgi:hypothetical protein